MGKPLATLGIVENIVNLTVLRQLCKGYWRVQIISLAPIQPQKIWSWTKPSFCTMTLRTSTDYNFIWRLTSWMICTQSKSIWRVVALITCTFLAPQLVCVVPFLQSPWAWKIKLLYVMETSYIIQIPSPYLKTCIDWSNDPYLILHTPWCHALFWATSFSC